MNETHVWLSPQGRAPVLVSRQLLQESVSVHFRRMFDKKLGALPPRVSALEAGTGGAPVYLFDAPEEILTMLLHISAHPQLAYKYSVDTSADAFVRQTYLRFYGLYTKKRVHEDDEDDPEEREAKKRKMEEDKQFDAECLKLFETISRGHPRWNAYTQGHCSLLCVEFINSYGISATDTDHTHYMEIGGKRESIARYFFTQGSKRDLRCLSILKNCNPTNRAVGSESLWGRGPYPPGEHTRIVTHWPAVNSVGATIDPTKHEIVRLTFC